ncbi:hypothetical protein EVAR_95617_1 [Eumeta japonica]|uniref:Uncharacterized protein n=1 Tax=Eumeta variegata TaxID=151549 RepID=A0A4C1VL30_EUMVA|nr:hypothetical protein EVAR_95617_1 [Eumeta japonica]
MTKNRKESIPNRSADPQYISSITQLSSAIELDMPLTRILRSEGSRTNRILVRTARYIILVSNACEFSDIKFAFITLQVGAAGERRGGGGGAGGGRVTSPRDRWRYRFHLHGGITP